ncbi:MAG: hypothetical protein V4805_04410 [Pseudomonadota bacterium]
MRTTTIKKAGWFLVAAVSLSAVAAPPTNLPADNKKEFAKPAVGQAETPKRLPVSVLMLLLDSITPIVVPPAPATSGPSGSVASSSPTFSWSPSTGATSYILTVKHGGSTTDFSTEYSAATAGCAAGSGTCSITPSFTFTAGTTYSWSVQGKNSAGTGTASATKTFIPNPVVGGTVAAPLAFSEQPFGALELIDTIDTATMAPATESPVAASSVKAILGQNARTLTPGTEASYITYRIGKNKGLVAKQAYVLDIEYPDDVPRAMFIANRGADFLRGFTTGSAVGDSRKAWTLSTLESLNYPQSNSWKHYHSLFYLHERFSPKAERNSICSLRDLLPADGFDVSIFQSRQMNDPRSQGAAVGKIRLYKVTNPAALPAAITYPGSLPRRHLFWREEMADEAVSNASASKRATTAAIDWFGFKMDMGRALGFNTVGKDMFEWGWNQGFDSGDTQWALNANPPLTNIWGEIVAAATTRGLELMPYLEYGGTLGYNCMPGYPCDKNAGTYKSMGFQRRTDKLFKGVYGPGCNQILDVNGNPVKDANGKNTYDCSSANSYTGVYWTEDKSADLTDPDTEADLKKVIDKLVVQYKAGGAKFGGVWLRMRQSKLPMSFSPKTLARYNTDNPNAQRSLTQLRNDTSSRQSYYDWWYGKRRAFLQKIRDYARSTGTVDNNIQLLFSTYPGEPVPDAFETNVSTSGLQLVTDDTAWWSTYRSGLNNTNDPHFWYRYKWSARTNADAISQRMHKNGLEKTWPIQSNEYNADQEEATHSSPPADPARYQNDDGIAMTYDFGNPLYTVSDSALLASYSNTAGQSLTHHFPLNEDNGKSFDEAYAGAKCADPATRATAPRYGLTDDEPFDGKLGYMSVAVERSGPFTVLAEATALANGNPINIAYLESSSMSRGFPAYVKRFNQALLSLPALPAVVASGMTSNAAVVVKQINSGSGTYYAVVNPTMTSKTAVVIDFGASSSLQDLLLPGTTYTAQKLQFDMYPGEVRTFRKP